MKEMMLRPYVCPLCGHKQNVTTNHTWEIYSPCVSCKSTPLYPEDDEREFKSTNWKVHHYYYDLDNVIDAKLYKIMCSELLNFGYRVFESIPHSHKESEETRKICSIINLQVHEVDSFPNQYITQWGRLHDWKEWIFHNKKIKQGYYIEKNGLRF